MHDSKGRPLTVGDTVLVPFKVTATYATEGEGYCNASLETVASMFPGTAKTSLSVNTRQAIRANDGDGITYEVVNDDNGAVAIG